MNRFVLSTTLIALLMPGCSSAPKQDPEARIVAYLNENVKPGEPVLVTDLYNNVFTAPEEQQALKRLYDATFLLPAFVADRFIDTGTIPTLNDISTHFDFKVPGTTEALLRVLESDPRAPLFFERDSSSGEIIKVDVETIRRTERFSKALKDRSAP
jgi:hypothetical protein